MAEGVCRYSVRQGDVPTDELRFRFQSVDLTLPRQGDVTPVLSFRDYAPDLPEGAPESERGVYAREAARFEVTGTPRRAGESGPEHGSQVKLVGLAAMRESEVLGLPWLPVAALKAGQSWESTESLSVPGFRERFRYQVVGMTTVRGHHAWRIERTLATRQGRPVVVQELKAPARVVRWQESFWVDAGGHELLRAERRLRLETTDESPVALTLELDWARTGTRPVPAPEYRAHAQFFARLRGLERKVQEAGARTTLDGRADLRELQEHLQDLRDSYPDPRYRTAFERLDLTIQQAIRRFEEQEEAPRTPGQAASFTLPDGEGRPTPLDAFRGRVVLLSFWTAG
jgi:hypothetical protein